jgi:RNA polymerase sigma-70 factor (ECF subfamily)
MPNLRMYARRLTRNEADTDDLVQDTLARAWAARERFEVGTNLKAWLMRIARNSFLSGKRKDRRSVSWDPAIAERLLIAPATQDEGILSSELNEAVLSLSAGQRAAFELVTRDGLTFEEAAGRLGVPLGTLKSRVSRARASLANRFETVSPISAETPTRLPALDVPKPDGANIYREWKKSGSRMIG